MDPRGALTDTDPMPFGTHKDKPMSDVPADYLAWLRDDGCRHAGVRAYIEDNWDAICMELPDRIRDR